MVLHATVPRTVQTEHIVEHLLESGRYANEEEVILAGLRLLMDYIERLETLEKEIEKGKASGNYHELDVEEFLSRPRKSNAT
jgi:putative addiction module CopG family antidote